MQLRLKTFQQEGIDQEEYGQVKRIGNLLYEYLSSTTVLTKLYQVNLPGNSSLLVQNVFLDKAKELGFQSEKKRLFSQIPTPHLRPDYYMKIKNSGIIIEVERGKTIMNNMDMLDMWKCHLCDAANHLFIFVPNELKHNPDSRPYDCFRIVSNRMAPFFNRENYCNVHSLWIFGY